MEDQIICSQCNRDFCTVFCCCVFPLPYLCNKCANSHSQKPGAFHTIRPIAESIGIKSRRDLHMVSLRLVNIKAGEDALRAKLDTLNACAGEIEGKFNGLIRRIIDIKQEKLALLQQIKSQIIEEINAVITDAYNHLIEIEGKPDFETDLARKVCHFEPEMSTDYILFHYSVSDPDPRLEQLIKVVMRPINIQVKSPPPPEKPTLTVVSQNFLHKFDVKSESWSSLTIGGTDLTDFHFELDSVSALYNDGIGLLCCGGGSPSTSAAYRIDITTGEVNALRNMEVARSGHGLVQFKGVFYAFGGYGSKKSSEKYENLQWESNPTEMHYPHQWFTACIHNDLIYLVGGDSKYIETFDPMRRVFEQWGPYLPEHISETNLSSFFYGSDVLILTTDCLGRWCDIQQQLTLEKHPKSIRSAWSNMTPIHNERNAVFLLNQELGYVLKFDINARRYVELKVPNIR